MWFKVSTDYLNFFEVRQVGDRLHFEYWIPAERLAEFNRKIVGSIEVIAEFPPQAITNNTVKHS
jgi:hypothetical protein